MYSTSVQHVDQLTQMSSTNGCLALIRVSIPGPAPSVAVSLLSRNNNSSVLAREFSTRLIVPLLRSGLSNVLESYMTSVTHRVYEVPRDP